MKFPIELLERSQPNRWSAERHNPSQVACHQLRSEVTELSCRQRGKCTPERMTSDVKATLSHLNFVEDRHERFQARPLRSAICVIQGALKSLMHVHWLATAAFCERNRECAKVGYKPIYALPGSAEGHYHGAVIIEDAAKSSAVTSMDISLANNALVLDKQRLLVQGPGINRL
nr:hypothetical protein [Sinorhizobium saheli]